MPPPDSVQQLENNLDRELNLACGGRCLRQETRHRRKCPRSIENICVIRSSRWCEVSVVKNIKHLGAELQVKPLRNSPDVVVLEDGEVQLRDTRSDQNISAGIAAKVVTQREGGRDRVNSILNTCRKRVAVLIPKGL